MFRILMIALVAANPARVAEDGGAAAVLARAETAFRQGTAVRDKPDEARRHFAQAADAFAELAEQGFGSAALYRDLGNAALLAGRLPEAILAYQRGLRLAPGDDDLRSNLDFARARVSYPAGRGQPADHSGWSWLTAETLLLSGLVLFAFACASLTIWLRSRRGRWLFRATVALVLAGLLGMSGWSLAQRRDWNDQHPLVIVAQDDVSFHRGNGLSYPTHTEWPTLPRGLEARRLHRRGDWLQIQLPGGAVGWLPADAVLVDEPPPPPL